MLIPRPETELLVEVALELEPRDGARRRHRLGRGRAGDRRRAPERRVVATDTSLDALAVAEANATGSGSATACASRYGSLEPGPFDLLVANLPYVSEAEWRGLAPEIRDYEPREALVAGPDRARGDRGPARRARARAAARPAAIALEVGAGQAATVAELVRRAGFERVEIAPRPRRDRAGGGRVES